MKILIACPYYHPYTSGMTVYAQRLAEGLAKRGHSIRVLTHNHNHFPEKEILNNVEIFRVPPLVKFGRGIFSHKMAKKFYELLSGVDVVNIHAPFFECGLLAGLAKKRGKKVFLTYHCDLVLTGLLSPIFIDKLHKLSIAKVAKYSDAIIVNSKKYAENSYVRKFSEKTIEVHPPIDDKIFRKVSGNNFRKKYRIEKNNFVVGFLGRLTSEKGLEHLVEAANLLEGKIKNLKVLIGGEGVLVAGGGAESVKPKLEKRIRELGLKNVIFTGKIPDAEMNEFFSSLNVFVLPSVNRLESFGMVQVEAMLCGAPVVASDIPGVSTAIQKTGFGILFESKNPQALASAIFKIFINRKKYLPERKMLEKEFGIRRFLESYENIFRS